MRDPERLLVGFAPLIVPGGEAVFVPARVMAFPWRAPEDLVTIAIKTTLSFAEGPGSGAVSGLWVEPPPFEPAVDLVPGKRACDVLLRGHAEIPAMPSGYAAGARAAELRVGPIAVARFLVDARRTGRILLGPSVVSGMDGTPGLDLGPRPVPAFARLAEGDFEIEACQVAAAARRIPFDEPVERIDLVGLLEAPEPLTLELPIITPRLLVDPTSADQELTEAPLVLDTILVDLDRKAVDLTWRAITRGSLTAIDRVIVGFGPDVPEDPTDRWSRVLAELPRGRFSLSYCVDDVARGQDPPPLEEAELDMARLEAWEHPIGPTPQTSLETYARVTAELVEAREPRDVVLGRHGLDERTFALEERAWTDAMTRVPEEEPSLATRYGELILRHQDELAAPDEAALTWRDYAALAVRMESRDPAKVLAEARMSQPAFMRLERRVDAMLEADAGLEARLDEEMDRVRASLPADVDGDLPPEVREVLE